jgi:hypothetical protein
MAVAVLAAQQHGGIAGELGLPDMGRRRDLPKSDSPWHWFELRIWWSERPTPELRAALLVLASEEGGVDARAVAAGHISGRPHAGRWFLQSPRLVQAAGVTAALPALARAAAGNSGDRNACRRRLYAPPAYLSTAYGRQSGEPPGDPYAATPAPFILAIGASRQGREFARQFWSRGR